MSQLRKSASFRSRIPVRKTKVPQRRCSSPQPTSSYSDSRQNSRQNKTNNLWYDRRYSSSSFSSSDESDESEAPLQVKYPFNDDLFNIVSKFCVVNGVKYSSIFLYMRILEDCLMFTKIISTFFFSSYFSNEKFVSTNKQKE